VDIMATLAEAAGVPLPEGSSPDGASELAALLDPQNAPAKRTETVFLGTDGFALRQGDWIYIPAQGSGGKSVPELSPRPWSVSYQNMGFVNSDLDEKGQYKADAPQQQLYSLATDLGQKVNLVTQHPEQQALMQKRIEQLIPNLRKKAQKSPPAP
jgi:arylsulfatase A-like enzyme